MGRYLFGIDLGTTNSALASVDLQHGAIRQKPHLQTFAVPQLVNAGELQARNLLPSFLYRPGQHDLPAGSTALPWNPQATDVVGEFARQQGARVPGRLVSSAKSWLCHPGVDRTAALLPFGAPPDVPKLSPLAASTAYLRHLADAWQFANPGEPLGSCPVVLTVPASFDDVARTLTVEAATQAGFKNVVLLEEPQAAFYCWLALAKPDEAAQLKPGMKCAVIDVGGGTSDFSLIEAVEQGGELHFVRQAVGDHLLLGGDNMDLALARFAEHQAGQKLDAGQFAALVQGCRQAKEVLLADDAPPSHTVAVMGKGRSVIGGSVIVPLSRESVRSAIFDGFFPACAYDAALPRGPRTGLQEMGLPYVSNPEITRHLAQFLRRHLDESAPDAILFNGGVFQPPSARARILEVMRSWYGPAWQPLLLTTPSLDLAVAWGAAHYAWIKHTGGQVIGGGTARSYYVGIAGDTASSSAETIPVLCVVPRHLEENAEVQLPEPQLELTLGTPAIFPLYTSTARSDDKPGQLLALKPEQLRQLPPLHTLLRAGKKAGTGSKQVRVTLAAKCTAIGTLELSCVAVDQSQRWRLEFNARDERDLEPVAPGLQELLPEAQLQLAYAAIRGTFAPDGMATPGDLPKRLDEALEAPRQEWSTAVCRRLWEPLYELADGRRRSPAHFLRWVHTAGYCLRPGFGDPLDRYRVEQLWKLWNAPAPAGTPAVPDSGADSWIMWRRIAGGLNQAWQQTLFDRLRPYLLPNKTKNVAKAAANELAEMWRAAASLERLSTGIKEQLAESLLKQIKKSPVPTYAFWALTRLGARTLFYGPLNDVVHPQIVERWLDAILPFEPTHPSERLGFGFCLAQWSRRSGQRALDIDDAVRERVLTRLRTLETPPAWAAMVERATEQSADERGQLFGESLPLGLRLA